MHGTYIYFDFIMKQNSRIYVGIPSNYKGLFLKNSCYE